MPPRTPPVFRDQIRSLDGLRGVAVLLVLILGAYAVMPEVAAIGCDLFFVLCGFLTTRVLLWDRAKGTPLRYFYVRRCLRILPVYYITLGVVWVVARDRLAPWAAVFGTAYPFTPTIHDTMLSHTGAVAVIVHAIMLWSVVVYWLPREWAKWAAIAAAFAAAALGPDRAAAVLPLALGAALGFYEGSIRYMEKRASWGVGAAAVLGLVMIRLGGVPVFAAAALVLAVRFRSSKAWAARPMNAGWLRYVGRISYGLYLYHLPVRMLMDADEGGVGRRVAAVAITFAVAVLSNVAIEMPLLGLKKRFASKGEAPKPKSARPGGLATHS